MRPFPLHRTPGPQDPQRKRGLTLVELVICVAVLATLGVLALPGLGAQLQHQRLRSAAQVLAGDLTEARFLAAQRGVPVFVQARAGPQWCWSVALDSACSCDDSKSCSVHKVAARDHPGVQLQTALSVALDPTGTAQSAQGAVLTSARGESLRVDVSPQGRARICALSGTWPQLPAC